MKNLFIIKQVIEDKNLSNEAFAVWCALRNIMQKDIEEYYISYYSIFYALYGTRQSTRPGMEMVKKGYKELRDLGYVDEVLSYSTSDFVVNLSNLYYDKTKGYFSDLTNDEMQKIMNLNNIGKINNCKLLRYFTCMIGTFNRGNDIPNSYRGKIGGTPLDRFAEMLDISRKTATVYNSILEENKLLYVFRHKDFISGVNSKGQSELREMPNTYSRWRDRNLADSYSSIHHGYKYFKEQKEVKSVKANENRGLAQKYNYFCNGKQYDIQTISDMYNYCIAWNAARQAYKEDQLKKGYKYEYTPKDTDVFNDYLQDIAKLEACV